MRRRTSQYGCLLEGAYIQGALRVFENHEAPYLVWGMSTAEKGGGGLIFWRVRYISPAKKKVLSCVNYFYSQSA